MQDEHFELHLGGKDNIVSPRQKKEYKKPSTLSSLRYFNSAGSIGFEIVLPLSLGFIIGIKVDERYQTKPLFTIIGFTIGFAISCASLIRIVKEVAKKG